MSQRSALTPAAIATADVSEPPRPSVASAAVGRHALEAGDDRDRAAADSASSSIADFDRLDPGIAVDARGPDQLPAHEAARVQRPCLQRHREQARRSPARRWRRPRHIRVGSWSGGGLAAELDQPVGLAGHRRDDDQHLVAAPRPRAGRARRRGGCARCPPSTCRRISSRCGALRAPWVERSRPVRGRRMVGKTSIRRPEEAEQFGRLAGDWWDPNGRVGDAAQAQPGAAQICPRPDRPALAVRRVQPHAARGQDARSTSAAAPGCWPSRWRGSARR